MPSYVLAKDGLQVTDHFISHALCDTLTARVLDHDERFPSDTIIRKNPRRSLIYTVVHGNQVRKHLNELAFVNEAITDHVNALDTTQYTPLPNPQVDMNVSILKPGGEYRWHYDRNPVTAYLYLNSCEGGKLEVYPRYRMRLRQKQHGRLQRFCDSLYMHALPISHREKVSITPRKGRLVLIRGNVCLHSVTPVEGQSPRITFISSLQEAGASAMDMPDLDSYLYTNDNVSHTDPNYAPENKRKGWA